MKTLCLKIVLAITVFGVLVSVSYANSSNAKKGQPRVSPPRYYFSIPKQPIKDAIKEIAELTGLHFIYQPKDLNNYWLSQEIRGEFLVTEILEQVLYGTNLSAQFVNDILIIKPSVQQIELSNAAEDTKLEEMTVEGESKGIVVSKSQASMVINGADIVRLSPSSTADILTTIPGLWVEKSSGVTGANIFVRGLPGDAEAPFFTLSLQGLPVFPAPTLAFLNNATMFRSDETVDQMAASGRLNTVMGNGQLGATTNVKLREGTDDFTGNIKYSVSDYGLKRIDSVVSGPLSSSTYYMFGGYISRSQGVRGSSFDTERGRQFTAHLTHNTGRGKIGFYHRSTDDHGIWYVSTPPQVGANYSFIGDRNRRASVPFLRVNQEGQEEGRDDFAGNELVWETVDIGKGRGWDGDISGFYSDIEWGDGWLLSEKAALTDGNANTLVYFPFGDITTIDTATLSASGANIDAGTDIHLQGAWAAFKRVRAFTNDLAISKRFEGRALVTVGVYAADWSVSDRWSNGNHKWYVLEPNGERLADDFLPCQAVDMISCGWSYIANSKGDAQETALYARTTANLPGNMTTDIGFRVAHRNTSHLRHTYNDTSSALLIERDSRVETYSLGFKWPWGRRIEASLHMVAGEKFDDFDEIRSVLGLKEHAHIDIDELELSINYRGSDTAVKATLFANTFRGAKNCGANCVIFKTEAVGAELQGHYTSGQLIVNATMTLLNATASANLEQATSDASARVRGNTLPRQPSFQAHVTPRYQTVFSDHADLSIYGTLSYIGSRTVSLHSSAKMDSYTVVDAGADLTLDQFSLQLSVNNLFDSQGVTESAMSNLPNAQADHVRYILPRNVKLTLGYHF